MIIKSKEWLFQGVFKIRSIEVFESLIHYYILKSGFKIKDKLLTKFDFGGRTFYWCLSESHCVVSYYHENKEAILYLASCNIEKYDKFLLLIKKIKSFSIDNGINFKQGANDD